MRGRQRAFTFAILALALVGAACSDDSGGSAPPYTPAATDANAGPNDTTGAPVTMQGTLRLDPATGCLALETDTVRFALTFDDYSLGDDGGRPALIADQDERVVAHDGNIVVLSGLPTDGAASDCGTPFDVDSFNSVIG